MELQVNEDARRWLAENGYDEKMGARPMARLIQDHIKKPLADELLFGDLADGGRVRVYLGEEGNEKQPLAFDITPKVPQLSKPQESTAQTE